VQIAAGLDDSCRIKGRSRLAEPWKWDSGEIPIIVSPGQKLRCGWPYRLQNKKKAFRI
jgi:hypothetical protein